MCMFMPPFAQKGTIFKNETHFASQIEDGRIKYVNNFITNPRQKTIRLSKRSVDDPKMCELYVKKLERKDLGLWKYLYELYELTELTELTEIIVSMYQLKI